MSIRRVASRFLLLLLHMLLLLGCAAPPEPPPATAMPLHGPQRTCAELFEFLEWGLVPGSTPEADMRALLEARLGDAFTNQRSTVAGNREKIVFVVGDHLQWQNPHIFYDLFLRDGILQEVRVHWDGLPRPTAHAIRGCLGEPEFYDAAFVADLQARYDLVFWYPAQGLRVGSVNYVHSMRKPELGDGDVFSFVSWVAPGSPADMLQSLGGAAFYQGPEGYYDEILARVKTWTGAWDDVEFERCHDSDGNWTEDY